ncbi:MAG: carbon-nitrogen hydrolase family protein [Firmicutes bacterium]|nr:carbon-nitrogen hydrolase family protein [Bacillota bacterium]
MKIACAQIMARETIEESLNLTLQLIEEAADNDADCILFPEIHLHKFFCQYRNLEIPSFSIESKAIQDICTSCKKNHIMAIPNLYFEENGKTFDASFLIDKTGKILGNQKMVHIAQAENFYEQDYYYPSDDGFKVFDTEFGKLGMVICFDRHYPESIRTEVLMGAECIFIPTANTKQEPSDVFEWEIRIQAFQNSSYIVMCNRIGKEGNMDFSGETIVVDPNGKVILKVDDQEGLYYANLSLSEVQKIRESKPYTNLRRKQYYL